MNHLTLNTFETLTLTLTPNPNPNPNPNPDPNLKEGQTVVSSENIGIHNSESRIPYQPHFIQM